MKINIDINDELMAKAQKLSGIIDKNALVEKALQLFVTHETQKRLSNLRGKVEIDDKAFE
jgi:Arc/MetJ family transcription regulator